MKTIKLRVRNPLTWLSPLISVVYLIGVVVLVVQNHKDISIITGGSGALLILLLSPALAPLFLSPGAGTTFFDAVPRARAAVSAPVAA